MSTYGDGGTTYGDLFGGGVKLYGDFGSSGSTTVAPPTRHKLIERSSATLRERSSARFIESSSDEVIG